jgi:hypothetical protein
LQKTTLQLTFENLHSTNCSMQQNFVSQCVIIMENYTNSEMTDMVFCYGSADGVRVVFRIRKHFWLLSTGNGTFRLHSSARVL